MTSINVVFNCDRTLVSIEGPDELAKKMKVKGIDELTERAMSGTEPFGEVFRRRFELYRPRDQDVQWLGKQYLAHITPGAREVVQTLQREGHRVYIVSAGYRSAILQLAKVLSIPALHVCAVDVEFDQVGQFLSFDESNILTTDEGLEIVLAEIARSGPTVYVGDSIRDLEALNVVDCMIGYGGAKNRREVEEKAHAYIREASLLPVLGYIHDFAAKQAQESTPSTFVDTVVST